MKKIFWFTLIIFTILIIIPPIHYGYIYPTAGDDTANHLTYFTHMNIPVEEYYDGTPPIPQYPLYWGQYIVGKMLDVLPFDPKISFSWFHFVMMIFAIWALGWSLSLSINYLAGILVILLIFGMSFLLTLFYWGTIFDLVGIAVLMPVILLSWHKWTRNNKWKVLAILSMGLFAVFHANGRYLLALIPIILAYEILASKVFNNWQWLKKYRILGYSTGMAGALVILYWIGVSQVPSRLWLDSSILFVMVIAGLIGVLIVNMNRKVIFSVVFLALVISLPDIVIWMQNNSAIKEADKEAISYVNSLDNGNYMISPQITRGIYKLYINKPIVNEDAQYIIARNVPMTMTSAIRTKDDNVVLPLEDYRLLKSFSNGEIDRTTGQLIEVAVYARNG